ncbi:MAG: C39 family peptidase [Candidatus Woesebacteria bacterium]
MTPTPIPTPTPSPLQGVLLNVPSFKQIDERWSSRIYDSGDVQGLGCGSTVGQCGCATTSIAMLLKYYGVDRAPNGDPTTPKSVNEYFNEDEVCKKAGCVSQGYRYGNVRWSAVGRYSSSEYNSNNTQKVVLKQIAEYDKQTTKSDINEKKPVIIRVPGRQHWVVAKGYDSETISINDPGFDRNTLDDPAYGNDALAMRRFEKTSSDFSSFEVTSLAPTQILVTDLQGRKTGYDFHTGNVVEEIPNSHYYFEESYSDISGEVLSSTQDGIYSVIILTPEQNEYEVEVVTFIEGLYTFSIHASDRDADTDIELFDGWSDGIETNVYRFVYSPEPNEITLSGLVDVDIKPGDSENSINCKNKNSIIAVAIINDGSTSFEFIDHTNVTFEGASEVHIGNKSGERKKHEEDVDGDGDLDLVFHFRLADTNLLCTDNVGNIVMTKDNGVNVYGKDILYFH